jgi:MFS family permease
MYAAYMVAIWSSSSFEIAQPAALADPNFSLTVEEIATALALGQVATVVGKLCIGFFIDARGAAAAFYEALLAMAALMLLLVNFVSCGLNSLALASFALYKIAKSAVWPAMGKASKAAFPSAIFGRVWGVLVTSSRVGSVTGILVVSPLVRISWQAPIVAVAAVLVGIVLLLRAQTATARGGDGSEGIAPPVSELEASSSSIAALQQAPAAATPLLQLARYTADTQLRLVVAVAGIVMVSPLVTAPLQPPILAVAAMMAGFVLLKRAKKVGADTSNPGGSDDPKLEPATISVLQAARQYATDPQLQLVVASETMMLTVMDTSYLLPMYLSSSGGVGLPVEQAGMFASAFPLGMCVAVLGGGWAYDALAPRGRAAFLLCCGLVSASAFLALASMTGGGGGDEGVGGGATSTVPQQQHSRPNLTTAYGLLFFAGAGFAPAKYLPSTIYVLENVESAHCGKVLAMMDVPGYILSAMFLKQYPWLARCTALASADGGATTMTCNSWSRVWLAVAAMVMAGSACICSQQLLQARKLGATR